MSTYDTTRIHDILGADAERRDNGYVGPVTSKLACTQRGIGPGCTEGATLELRWSERISDGWVVTTRRCYCQHHADLMMLSHPTATRVRL